MGNPRDLWRPKHPERESQCAGCPFGKDNNKQFGTILNHIKKKTTGDPRPLKDVEIDAARFRVKYDLARMGGDFVCHATAYGPGTELNERTEFKQCPGASEYYRNLPVLPSYQQEEDHGRRSGTKVRRARR